MKQDDFTSLTFKQAATTRTDISCAMHIKNRVFISTPEVFLLFWIKPGRLDWHFGPGLAPRVTSARVAARRIHEYILAALRQAEAKLKKHATKVPNSWTL